MHASTADELVATVRDCDERGEPVLVLCGGSNVVVADEGFDGTVVRVPKAYPAYFGAYAEFDTVRALVDAIPNLFLVGRNGMHRYNNQDHSMLTAKAAVANIVSGRTDKANLWDINVDDDYMEEK